MTSYKNIENKLNYFYGPYEKSPCNLSRPSSTGILDTKLLKSVGKKSNSFLKMARKVNKPNDVSPLKALKKKRVKETVQSIEERLSK